METPQNLLKISTVSPPDSLQAERQRRHSLMTATTIEWSSFLRSTNSKRIWMDGWMDGFSSARRH